MGKDKPTEETEDTKKSDSQMLTPWQEANLSYLKENGLPLTDVPPQAVEAPTSAEVSLPDAQKNADAKKIDEATDSLETTIQTAKDLPKSQSFADKLPKMKVARQKRLKKRLTLLVSVFGVSALGMIYCVSPLSKLNQIEIVGNHVVSKTAIAEATKLSREDMIWSAYLNKKAIPNIKQANPRINTVTVNLSRINNLKYTMTEFSEIAYAKENDTFHPVLENGTILDETTTIENEEFPILIDFQEGESLDNLMTHFKDVSEEVKANIKEIHSTPADYNEYLVRMIMKDENEIVASTKDFQEKINFYPQVAAEMDAKGVVDMEAGVYWKSFATIDREKAEEKAAKEHAEWLKSLEDENAEKNN